MRLFKNKKFAQFALENGITDARLCRAIKDADKGLIEADLGGGVIKQRIARENEGKSGGYRTIIFYRKEDRAFFVYGFAKNDKANITQHEKKTLKAYANTVLDYSDKELKYKIKNNELIEIIYDKEI